MHFSGLTDEQVLASRARYGSNEIPDSRPKTFWEEFRETFKDPMIKILLFIAVLMIVMYFFGYSEIYEPMGTIAAILIVAYVSAKTGVASDLKFRELKEEAKKSEISKVYRSGSVCVLPNAEIVVGDKVLLQSGDRVPADGVLADGFLRVDNSVLNGEAEECAKTAAPLGGRLPEQITGDSFVDASSLFRGAVVFDGEGVLDVQRVGSATMMGQMAEELQEQEPDSPLKVKLNRLAGQISRFGYISAVIISLLYMAYFVFGAGGPEPYLARGLGLAAKDLVRAVSLAVVIIVCAVPEGLPLMISLVLMQNTTKMQSHNVLVRKAEGIETAGSLNILFSDKTGTITKGLLEVVEFFTADGSTVADEELCRCVAINRLLHFAIGRNTASLFDGSHRVIGGNATDQALMRFLGEEAYLELQRDEANAVTASQSFNSANKFSQAYIASLDKTFYKGAPEVMLEHAQLALDAQGRVTALDRRALDAKLNRLAQKAMRLLAFGYAPGGMQENVVSDRLVLIGFAAIRDEVRGEARDAIREVQRAGIQVVMITGDRLETAAAIAKDAGLLRTESDLALTSGQLAAMSDEEIKKIVPELRVIARALPTDKSRLVRICQEMNLVVGMTGDGVNDSPALRRADIGFAMGSGTEAAKESGDIVVLDDNFRSIKDAILYGRTIYHNILKFCRFQLTINVAAVVVSAAAPFFGVEEPLKVTHLLFVNLVMDSLGAIMLGNEPALEKYMDEAPRRRDENLISREMLEQIAAMGCWLVFISFVFLKMDFFRGFFAGEAQQLTAYFVLFIAAALFNGFNVRDTGFGIFARLRENPGFLQVFAAILLIQAAIVNAPLIPLEFFALLGNMFSCVPFGLSGWLLVLLLAATMVPADLLRKAVTGKR